MALTFNDVVDRVRSIAPEVSQALAVSFVNERTGRMVSEAEYRMKNTPLTATTVSGTNVYSLDTDTVDLSKVWIGTDPYTRVSYEQIVDLTAGRRSLSGEGGVFAPYYSTTSTPQIILYPTPSTTGTSITVVESLHPSDSVYSGTDNLALIVPKHLRPYVLDGALADAYEFTGRQDLAQFHEQRYEQGTDKLRRLKNTRAGSGVGRIALRGRWA